MYYLGDTPVEPTGAPISGEMPVPSVVAADSATDPMGGQTIEAPPINSDPTPLTSVSVMPAEAAATTTALPPITVSLPIPDSAKPDPVDYSTKRHKYGKKGGYGGKHSRVPVNIFYTDPTPYYPPVSYYNAPPQPAPIYVINRQPSSQNAPTNEDFFSSRQINWVMIAAIVAIVILLKR